MAVKKVTGAKSSRPVRKQSAAKSAAGKNAANESFAADAGDQVVTIDRRRGSRRQAEADDSKPAPVLERRQKVQRRRQIDPTTCERDYSIEEVEFMNAMDAYKRTSGRMFPTCSEVLEVIRDLGYVKLSSAGLAILQAEHFSACAEGAELEAESAEAPATM